MLRITQRLAFGGIAFWLAAASHAGPALFDGSFIVHAFGSGQSVSGMYYVFTYARLPARCLLPISPLTSASPTGPVLETHGFCHLWTMAGNPATGTGTLTLVSNVTGPPGVLLPQSAFGITTSQRWPTWSLTTYATFHNAAGSFFAGGGPAASGTRSRVATGTRAGTWRIQPGEHAFGGPMALLGQLGARESFSVPPQSGVYEGTGSWNMIKALGRRRLPVTSMGAGPDPLNPYTNTAMFVNMLLGRTAIYTMYGTGTPWTTGSVTLYAKEGYFETVLRRHGFDTFSATSMGGTARNIQLVTPGLTHWRGSNGSTDHTGHIGILKLRIVPEPGALLMLAVGTGVLVALRRALGRR